MDSHHIPPGRLYNELSEYWPLISRPEEYADVAAAWKAVIREKLGPGRHRLLELGVGGGHNLSHFSGKHEVTAVDLSENMMAHSRQLNPTVEHLVGDMRTIRLNRTFDGVVIHDAIGHMLTESDLSAVFATASVHLEKGGLFITSPDHTRESFVSGKLEHNTHSNESTDLTCVEYTYDPDPADTTVEMIMFYIIRQKGSVRIEHDRHVLGIFAEKTWLDLLEKAGFAAEKREFPEQSDWGPNFIGVKR